MIHRQFLILPILTERLGTIKIATSLRRMTHDTQKISHPPNIDLEVRNNEDHHQFEEEDP